MTSRTASVLVVVLLLASFPRCATTPLDGEITISDVQGEGHVSPLAGEQVTVEGVVTAVVRRERDAGFFMQDVPGDGDPDTSDAMFVDMSKGPPEELPAVGDRVHVTGVVEERGREKQLSNTILIDVAFALIRSNDPLPSPVVVGRRGRTIPAQMLAGDGLRDYDPGRHVIDFWESLEGMLIEVPDAVVTGATSSYGDLVVLPDEGAGTERRTIAHGVILREDDLNLDRIVLDPRLASQAPMARVGDRFTTPLRGVVHYDFSTPRLLPLEWPQLAPGAMEPEVTPLQAGDNALTVASYNVLNLSLANPEERFTDVARTIVSNLRVPDIIGLQEIQDDSGANRETDGIVTAQGTMQRLADAIRAAGGPRYEWAQIDPELDRDGGQPGGNIRVVWMYRPDRVTLVPRGQAGPRDATAATEINGRLALTLSPGRIEPRNPCVDASEPGEEGSRKPLAAEFVFEGDTLFLVNAHLASKGDDDRIFGSTQPPQRASEARRTCQAGLLKGFVSSLLEIDPEAKVILLGDMNEHEFRAPAMLLEGTDLVSLTRRVPQQERYTYNFEGNSQVLDHILVSPSLIRESDPQIDIVHVNTDFPSRSAASDHDPTVARFRFDVSR